MVRLGRNETRADPRLDRVAWTIILAVQTAVLDLGVKQLAQRAVIGPASLGPVAIVRSYNEGLLMGLGADLGPGAVLVFTTLVTAALAVIARRGAPPLPGGLLLGGALGNVLDRIPDGRVTDLLTVGSSPVFNLADVSIFVGFTIMLFAARGADGHAHHDDH